MHLWVYNRNVPDVVAERLSFAERDGKGMGDKEPL